MSSARHNDPSTSRDDDHETTPAGILLYVALLALWAVAFAALAPSADARPVDDLDSRTAVEPTAGTLPASGSAEIGSEVDSTEHGGESTVIAKLTYGKDDRVDVYEVEDRELVEASEATVALVYRWDLIENADGTFTLRSMTFGDAYGLCPEEPYRDQPAAAYCSGFLVGPDLIATAGHCISTAGDCAATAFVFGYHMLDAKTPVLTFGPSDVYFCREIVASTAIPGGADWALVRLDREVEGRVPLRVRHTEKIRDAQSLVVIGHPGGLPAKIDAGGAVRDNTPASYFSANLDTYGGSSGSAVLNAETSEVEGLLVRGDEDFVAQGNCMVSNRCPDDGCRGEDVTRSTEFAHLIEENSPGDSEPLLSEATSFRRGDTDGSARVNITDAIRLLEFVAGREESLDCPDAADANDDGAVDGWDAICLLTYLFGAGTPPSSPGPAECGLDTSEDALPRCEATESCR